MRLLQLLIIRALPYYYCFALPLIWHSPPVVALTNGVKTRSFVFSAKQPSEKPKLVVISGCPGTGKSTFGMSVALDQGILKCISTDTVRQVMRSFIPQEISPALHRSSYAGTEGDDPVKSWRETCTVLEASVEGLVEDALSRGVGLVLEGVSIAPSSHLLQKWEEGGGIACGCLLTVQDKNTHKKLLSRRGFVSGEGQQKKDQNKMNKFDRIRRIQDEMIRLAQDSKWLLIEQKVEPDPLEIIANKLFDDEDCRTEDLLQSLKNHAGDSMSHGLIETVEHESVEQHNDVLS